VLVLFHKDRAADILFSAGGTDYAVSRIRDSVTPTAEDRKMADLILHSLRTYNIGATVNMSDIAVKWNDLEMWKAVVKKSGSLTSTYAVDSLVRAWKAFSFESVRARRVTLIHIVCQYLTG
jgi:hypothetical protein